MRLGGPTFREFRTPDEWVSLLRTLNYSAAYCPYQGNDARTTAEYAAAAKSAGIVIAEVGVWNNPLSRDPQASAGAIRVCKERLALADRIGALCCVNIAGSRGEKWDGPCPDDLTDDTFDLLVSVVRDIIDSVKPSRAAYSLETMPWMYPDSIDSSLQLIRAIDRNAFGIHFDPVNLINCPERYFRNGTFISDFIAQVGKWITSVHAKDIVLRDHLTVHLDEVRPGLGKLDYGTLLREIEKLDPDMPVLVEHLGSEEEYAAAVAFIRDAAKKAGVAVTG
jgi:sugar phosphate isomerase/epimerase